MVIFKSCASLADLLFISFLLIVLPTFGKCNSGFLNSTNNFMFLEEEQLMKGRFLGLGRKTPKFLTFNTHDDDVTVEMQLSVPFLTIPVKKTMNTASNLMNKIPAANINLAAIGVAGAVIFGSVFILPSVLKLMKVDNIHQTYGWSQRKDDPLINNEQTATTMDRLSRALDTHGASPVQCAQKVVCTMVRKASSSKNQNSIDKIVDGLASNEWIRNFLDGTFLSDALLTGYGEESCSTKYSHCKINQNTLYILSNLLSKT